MKIITSFALIIAIIFFGPFVAWKYYGWFSPHCGFDLPTLTYLNVFALEMVLFIATRGRIAQLLILNDLVAKVDEEYDSINRSCTHLVVLVIGLGIGWIVLKLMF